MVLMIATRTTPPAAIPMTASLPSLVDEETALSGEDGVVVVKEEELLEAVAGFVGSGTFISARSISTLISLPEIQEK
jgi:hypothetical protein